MLPYRILSDSEVASMYKEYLDGTDVPVPWNVVTPSLRKELEKAGVNISYADVKQSNGSVKFAEKFPEEADKVRYSDRDSYAPTFYSHMGKVIDDIKLAKMGAGGVVPYLKGKGVKNEEIKWSGIEAFLEGKKSVTKAELQEFVAGSQLQIQEELGEGGQSITLERSSYGDDSWNVMRGGEVLDTYSWNEDSELYESDTTGGGFSTKDRLLNHFKEKYGSGDTRWGQYKLDGGENYRELIFKMPNSSYSNQAMRVHWGEDAEGVLAHARIQDFDVDGKKMLFVEEIQWRAIVFNLIVQFFIIGFECNIVFSIKQFSSVSIPERSTTFSNIVANTINTKPIIKFEIGPATAVKAIPFLGSLKFLGLTLTGFA
jgi:hypothetical protein